jgi:hypothetical protein
MVSDLSEPVISSASGVPVPRRGAVTGDHVQRQSSASESQDKLPVTTTKDKRLFTRRTFRGIFAVPIPGMMT